MKFYLYKKYLWHNFSLWIILSKNDFLYCNISMSAKEKENQNQTEKSGVSGKTSSNLSLFNECMLETRKKPKVSLSG